MENSPSPQTTLAQLAAAPTPTQGELESLKRRNKLLEYVALASVVSLLVSIYFGTTWLSGLLIVVFACVSGFAIIKDLLAQRGKPTPPPPTITMVPSSVPSTTGGAIPTATPVEQPKKKLTVGRVLTISASVIGVIIAIVFVMPTLLMIVFFMIVMFMSGGDARSA